jgi:hypothetical protein
MNKYLLKLIPLLLLLTGMRVLAEELTLELHRSCVNANVKNHSTDKNHPLEADAFNDYCTCETDYVVQNASKEQLNLWATNPSKNPQWLRSLRLKAFKSCLDHKQHIVS